MDRDRERQFKRKRSLSFIIVLGYLFFEGCEYVVILPTVWDYLQTLGVKEEQWLGFAVSIYSFAAAIAGLIGGTLADKYYGHTKLILLVCIAFRAVGNFQYLLGLSRWNILCARMMCGIGSASATAALAEVCRTTTVGERTTFLSICNAMYQIGVLVGPALQFILSYFRFTIYGIHVNPLNAPGLLLGALWLLYWLATIFMFYNLTDEFRDIEERRKEKNLGGRGSILIHMSESIQVPGERALIQPPKNNVNVYKMYKDEFLTDSFILLMSLVFALYFSLVGLETVIPVITQDYFRFDVNENSLVYMMGGLVSLVAFAGIALVSTRVRETTLQIIAWLITVSAQVWLIVVMPNFERGNQTHMVYFVIGVFLVYLGTTILTVGNVGLSSKVLSSETQGLGQGFRRLIGYVGLIFGPMWSGSTVRKPYLFLGVTIGLMVVNGVMLLASHKSLRQAEDKISVSGEKKDTIDDESTPLLRSMNLR